MCPSSGTVLALPAVLVPNVALRKSIEVWAEKHARWMLVRILPVTHVGCNAQHPASMRHVSRLEEFCATPFLTPHLAAEGLRMRAQGRDGKVKPIPDEEDFARPGTAGQEAADLTLAVHLQQEELLTGHQYSPMGVNDR